MPGVSEEQVLGMTLNEVQRVLLAAGEAGTDRLRTAMTAAWATAVITRAKRPPRLNRVLAPLRRRKKAPSRKEINRLNDEHEMLKRQWEEAQARREAARKA